MMKFTKQSSRNGSQASQEKIKMQFLIINLMLRLGCQIKKKNNQKNKLMRSKQLEFCYRPINNHLYVQEKDQVQEILEHKPTGKKKRKKKNSQIKIHQDQKQQIIVQKQQEKEKDKIVINKASEIVHIFPKKSEKQQSSLSSKSQDQEKQQKDKPKKSKKKKSDKKTRKLIQQLKHRSDKYERGQREAIRIYQKQSEKLMDLVRQQLEQIYHYFLHDLQVLIPYSGKYGKYRLTIKGSFKDATMQWNYSGGFYPNELIELQVNIDNLSVLEKQKVNKIISSNRQICQSRIEENKLRSEQEQQRLDYILDVATGIHLQLLVMVYEQEPIPLLKHHKKSLQIVQKKEIYQEILDEIFYLHDFIDEPQLSLVNQREIEENNTVKHYRGRYTSQFQQLELVGEGGFGRVYKARNKLDKNIYAIKKIAINYADPRQRKLIKEVSLLSKLNHPNIVRYHQSWLEDTTTMEELLLDMSISGATQGNQIKEMYNQWHNQRMGTVRFTLAEEEQESEDREDSQSKMFQENDMSYVENSQVIFEHNSESANELSHITAQLLNQKSTTEFPFKILYIQMEFCQGTTLKQYINKAVKEDDDTKVQIVRGILEGLTYIHRKRIIHRDLKPANIFLDSQCRKAKIGDFGLATAPQTFFEESKSFSVQHEADFSEREKGVGTGFYRAPEQLKTDKYDEKADLYSLGIIMIELWYPFDTFMQRYEKLKQVTETHKLPKDFSKWGARKTQYQQQIQSLICENPQERPSAQKLLQNFRNKYFTQLVSCIANPKHFQFYQLLKHLFNIKNQSVHFMRKDRYKSYSIGDILKVYQIHRGSFFTPIPLLPITDHQILNGHKVPQNRKEKFLVLSEKGVIFEYAQNTYNSWIKSAKETIKKRKGKTTDDEDHQLRRYTFEKVVQYQDQRQDCKDQYSFKEKFLTGFDIAYSAEQKITNYILCEMLKISISVNQTLNLTQINPPILMCHSKVYIILSKILKIPIERLYSTLLSTTQEKFGNLSLQNKIAYFQQYNIDYNSSNRICTLLQKDFEEGSLWLQEFKFNCPQYEEIADEVFQLTKCHKLFSVTNLKWKLQIPPNNCYGFFWNNGPVKGFSSLEQISNNEKMCNIHLEMTILPTTIDPDVSIWCNGQFLEDEIMQVMTKCWESGVSGKWYNRSVGERDETCKNNIIIKKRNNRVYLTLRKAFQNSKKIFDHKKQERQASHTSKEIIKDQFDFDSIKTLKTKKSFGV